MKTAMISHDAHSAHLRAEPAATAAPAAAGAPVSPLPLAGRGWGPALGGGRGWGDSRQPTLGDAPLPNPPPRGGRGFGREWAPEPGFGVYVHWPFCAQKCPYCDFNSHVRFRGWDEDRFRAAFLAELGHVARLTGPRVVASVFIGGGTPSLMQPATVAAILDRIASLWTLAAGAEITLEANPGSVEAGRFAGYRAAGVNRVSLGVQSLRDAELRKLGRIHSVAEARTAIAIAAATFDRFSFDLIYARPQQTPQAWRAELGEALTLAGRHLSLYQLTIEPETPFAALHAAGRLAIPDADAAGALYELTQEMTEAAGLPAYEISNHAAPGEESRHNLLYWRYGEYAGVGPGAHGRLVVEGRRLATVTERMPEAWAARVHSQGHGFGEVTPLRPAETVDEALLMGLRLREGVDLRRVAALGAVRPAARTVDELVGLGLLQRSEDAHRLRATFRGRFVLDAVLARLAASLEPIGEPEESARAQASAKRLP